MSIIKTSLFLSLFNKLDIQENTVLLQAVKNSFIINKFNNIVETVQNKTSSFTQTSKLVQNIDNFILILLSLLFIAIPFASTKIIGLITIMSFALFLIKVFCVKGEKHYFTGFDILIFLYMAIAGLSVAFSSLFIPSMKGYIKMLIYFGAYLTFINIFKNNPKRMIYIISLVALTAFAEAGYAVYQQFRGVEALASWQDINEVNPEQLMNRVYGSLKPLNPNLLAGYLVAAFSSVLGMSFWFLSKKNIRYSLLFFIGTLAVFLAIIFTGSRGAYIAAAVMSFVFILISGHIIWHDFSHHKWLKRLWLISIVLGLAAIIMLVLSSPSLQHRITSIFMFRADSSNSYRFNVYFSCIKIFLDNWLVGIGPGNNTFRLIYGLYMVTGFDALGAYSIPLEIVVESGIFALLVFVWLIIFAFIRSIKYICANNPIEDKIIVSSCIIGILGLMAHGLVDTIWYRPQVNLIFWMLLAILAIKSSEKYPSNEI
jgi:putative inorganic carbon (HCO3(-)) transporter